MAVPGAQKNRIVGENLMLINQTPIKKKKKKDKFPEKSRIAKQLQVGEIMPGEGYRGRPTQLVGFAGWAPEG